MNHSATKKGFTLIEALVAISILMIAIVAPMSIAYKSIAMTTYAKNKLISQYLAADAAEYILAQKGINENTGGGWLDGFATCDPTTGNKACYIDTSLADITGAVNPCVTSGSAGTLCTNPNLNMHYNTTTGVYQHQTLSSTNIATGFNRYITIDDISATEAKVTVTVTWPSSIYLAGSVATTYVLRLNIYAKGP